MRHFSEQKEATAVEISTLAIATESLSVPWPYVVAFIPNSVWAMR
jgi:hypothetical protein